MTLKHTLCGGAAAFALLLGGGALPLLLSTTAAAQASTAVAPMSGVWAMSTDNNPNTQDETYVQITEGETITGETWQVTASGKKKVADMTLRRVGPDRMAGSVLWQGDSRPREVEIIAPPGKTYRLMLTSTGGRYKGAVYLRPVGAVGAPYETRSPEAVREAFTGDWSTPFGLLRIVPQNSHLEGRVGGSTVMRSPQTIVGERVQWGVGSLDWDKTVDLVLSPDGQELQGFSVWEFRERHNWSAVKVAAGRPGPAPGTPPGVYELTPFAGDWMLTDRAGAPTGKLTLAMGATSLSGRVIQPDGREGERFEFPFRANNVIDSATGTWAFAAHGGRAGLLMGEDGQSLTLESVNGRIRTFFNGKRAAAATPAPGRGPAPAPAPPPTPAPIPGPAPAPAPSQPSPPVVVAEPARPAPGQPTPVPTGPAGAARSLAQPGVFHALDDFDVRLDQMVPARDGAVNVFVTVKNKAGKEKYISTAAFLTVQLTDSDGVSVRQNQMYRATAEGSESLPAGMTLPADGELKGRFTITPPEVHGLLRTVSIRQSDKKAVWFDASGADANPSASSAPAAGGGAFKPLSKFDLRIDNIAPARDGMLEAFVTFRNPGRDWRYLSEGVFQLRGTDRDGAILSTRSQFYTVRGERGADRMPAGMYVEPGAETRLRLIWERPVNGPIKVSDGTVEQIFTAGG